MKKAGFFFNYCRKNETKAIMFEHLSQCFQNIDLSFILIFATHFILDGIIKGPKERHSGLDPESISN